MASQEYTPEDMMVAVRRVSVTAVKCTAKEGQGFGVNTVLRLTVQLAFLVGCR